MAPPPRAVVLHYERDFPYPVDAAYAWLTDYQDDDHERAGAIVKARTVVRREHDQDGRLVEVEFQGHLETFGQATRGRGVVRLDPDQRRWVATLGDKGRWVYVYQLIPAARGSRLLIDYRFGSRRLRRRVLLWLMKPFIRREIDKMWDGFSEAMEREMGPPSRQG